MTLQSATHEVVRAGYGFAKIMLIGAVLPIVAVSLLSLLG